VQIPTGAADGNVFGFLQLHDAVTCWADRVFFSPQMGHVWDIYGTCMGHLWVIYSTFKNHLWDMK
jgi:hypothetical protein